MSFDNSGCKRASLSSYLSTGLAPSAVVIGSLLLSGGGLLAAGETVAAPPEFAEGRILVKPRAGLDEKRFAQILGRNFARIQRRMGRGGVHLVEVPANAERAAMRALARNPHVEFAELDRLVSLPQAVPDDQYYPNAWHLPNINAEQAWNSARADGVLVAVLDTGVDASHADLSGKLVAGWNAVSDSDDTSDISGHGTMVAGTVAAETDNAEGVSAVAANALILPVRVSNYTSGTAFFSDIARGLIWAADQGAQVANISYAVSHSRSIASAAQYMRSLGGVVVVAAGNNGTDAGYADSPYMITVSATDSSEGMPSWSSYGEFVDVAAPGSGIWTTVRGGSYGAVSGTSFASPVTAGVAALIMGANPGLTPDEVEAILEESAKDLGGPGKDSYFGHGRVDAAAAVSMALGGVDIDAQAPSVAIFSPDEGSTVNDMVTVEVSASDDRGVIEVALYADGAYVGSDAIAPFQFSWDSSQLSDGPATLTAYAYDAADNEGVSQPVMVTVTNHVNAPPSAAFDADTSTGEAPLPVGFDATASDDDDGSIVAYAWSFGDGAIGSGLTTEHTYADAGDYLVTLTVTDDAGASDSTSMTVSVSEPAQTSSIELNTSVTHRGSRTYVFLDWSGAGGTKVEVVRTDHTGNQRVRLTSNDGAYRDRLSDSGTFTYMVCETTGACSNEIVIATQ